MSEARQAREGLQLGEKQCARFGKEGRETEGGMSSECKLEVE